MGSVPVIGKGFEFGYRDSAIHQLKFVDDLASGVFYTNITDLASKALSRLRGQIKLVT